jgi:hypothetical protein
LVIAADAVSNRGYSFSFTGESGCDTTATSGGLDFHNASHWQYNLNSGSCQDEYTFNFAWATLSNGNFFFFFFFGMFEIFVFAFFFSFLMLNFVFLIFHLLFFVLK